MRNAFPLLICLGLVACQKGAPPSSPNAKSIAPAKVEDTGAASKPKAPKSKEELALEKVGQACVADHACPLYLRCYSGACAVPASISGVKNARTPVARFLPVQGQGTPVSFSLELAVDDRQRARGLMYRRSILPDWGMLFIYGANRPMSFWMKNTYIPLDMVFIDQRGVIVGILENVPPLTLEPRTVGKPARYVLELGTGIAAKSGLSVGMRMKLESSPRDEYQPFP